VSSERRTGAKRKRTRKNGKLIPRKEGRRKRTRNWPTKDLTEPQNCWKKERKKRSKNGSRRVSQSMGESGQRRKKMKKGEKEKGLTVARPSAWPAKRT